MENIVHELSMYITKSSLHNVEMRWSAVNSDTDWDLYGERMTLELYTKMLSYIKDKVPPPAAFKSMVISDYWQGGMPYLSIAHYPDLNGLAVPGTPTTIYIDGKQLKAKGILFDKPLGREVWKSLKQDELQTKSDTNKNKIRISIAFLDLAHKHGENGEVFKRESLDSVCAECRKGVGEKIYLDGYLVHLALTRVPVNTRTIIQPEDAMTKKSQIQTKKEDALSIVEDSNLVEEIAQKALETKSDILVEMSEAEVEKMKHKNDESPMENEGDEKDMMEDKKEEKDMKKKSLTEEDLAVIANVVKSVLTETKAPEPVVVMEQKSEVVEKSALDIATDNLYNHINQAIEMAGTVEQKLESINPALQTLGATITDYVRKSVGVAKADTVSNDQSAVLEAIQALSNQVAGVISEVATLKAQTAVAPKQPIIPAPRSIQVQQPIVAQSQAAVKPNSVRNIVRRSVSPMLPPVSE